MPPRNSSLIQWLLLPLFWVESHESVVRLHLDPAHLVSDVDPALGLEELGSAELCAIIWHVIEHVEKDCVWEDFDSGLG